MAQAPLAKDIELEKPYFFCQEHIDLCRRKPLGRQFHGCIGMDGPFADQHPAGVDALVVGKILHQGTVFQDAPLDPVLGRIFSLSPAY